MEANGCEGKAPEAQALRDMEFMRETDRHGDGTEYTYRQPKAEPHRLATASQLDRLRGLLPAIEGVRTLLKGGCGKQAATALSFALGRVRVELEGCIEEIDGQRAKQMLDRERAGEALLVGLAAVGAVFLTLVLANLLTWPVCAACGKRNADLRTWTVETAPGREANVCLDCAYRIVADRLAE